MASSLAYFIFSKIRSISARLIPSKFLTQSAEYGLYYRLTYLFILRRLPEFSPIDLRAALLA